MPNPSDADADEPLKRLGGGRWETRDGRFTIEPGSGTWSVLDAEETDDLGLPLVRGPFRSLTDAKAAIATARESKAPASPLADRVRERGRGAGARAGTARAEGDRGQPDRGQPGHGTAGRGKPDRGTTDGRRSASEAPARAPRDPTGADEKPAKASRAAKGPSEAPEAEEEPGWFRDLSAADRGRARRLIERLTAIGIPDADSIVRRDLVGEVPAIAAAALERRLGALPDDAPITDIIELLVEGRDDDLGVRWRLVDGDGRPIVVDTRAVRRARR